MSWTVEFTTKSSKQAIKLPENIRHSLGRLIRDIEIGGPMRVNWKSFGQLKRANYHCHLRRGRPTYVACWEVVDKKIQIIEVYYVGTHEKAPY